MAQIDPNIALGFRLPQIESPVNQFAKAQELSVNALKMNEMQRGVESQNKLRQLYSQGVDISTPEGFRQIAAIDPATAVKLRTDVLQGQKLQGDIKKGQADLEGTLMKNARNSLAPINDQGTYDLWRQQTSAQLPGIAQFLPVKFDDKVKTSLMLEADKYIAQTQISAAQQQTADITKRGQDLTNQRALDTQKMQYGADVVANTVTDAAGNVTQFNRFGKVIGTPGAVGKPSATFEKTAALQKQQGRDLDLAIKELTEATKDKGLIDQSTGSGAGRLVDVAAGVIGQATPGAIAIAKLKPIADMALKMVPRFEGPQSDKDTASYKEAAGQLADPSLPTEIRKQAGKEVLRLMKARKGQFVNEAMANEGIGASGVDTSNPLLK